MQHEKFFSISVFFALSIYGAVSFYFLPSANFDGDLTRIGMLPESLFGWEKPQPAIDTSLMKQSPIQEADVFVIGDSFSEGLVWQSVFTKAGFKVHTESWKSVGNAICADITPWLRSQGFVGTYVIIETVEREIAKKLRQSVACERMHPRLDFNAHISRTPPATSLTSISGQYAGRLSTRFKILLNVMEYDRLERQADVSTLPLPNNVRLVRKEDGCELFSHARCKDSLFLAEDRPDQIDEGALENIETLNQRFSGIKPIWVFVPNKSTTYLYPNKKFWGAAERRFLAPNLLSMNQRAIQMKTVDLYPANNTHYSTTGYLLMGAEVLKTLRQAQ